MGDTRIIPADSLRKLTIGSYEWIIARVEDAVLRESVKVFGAATSARVIGTYPGHAIVMAEGDEPKFARVHFAVDAKGVVTIQTTESINVKTYGIDEVDELANAEASRVVDLVMRGDLGEATKALSSIASLCVAPSTPRDEAGLLAALSEAFSAKRAWRAMFESRRAQIEASVQKDLAHLDASRLRPKFERLYASPISESESDKFRDLVMTQLASAGERINGLVERIEQAFAPVKGSSAKADDPAERATLAAFESFASDVVEDLRGLRKTVLVAERNVRKVGTLAKLYDSLAANLYPYEVAGCFVENQTSRLCGGGN